MHDLFISYAREDEAWVERFCELLKTDGLIVWKDSSIPTGKSFGRVIEEAIASSRAVVSMLLPQSDGTRIARSDNAPACAASNSGWI